MPVHPHAPPAHRTVCSIGPMPGTRNPSAWAAAAAAAAPGVINPEEAPGMPPTC